MNRRGFLKLLGAAIAAPFVAKAKLKTIATDTDGQPYWSAEEQYKLEHWKGWEFWNNSSDAAFDNFDDDYEDDYEEQWPELDDGPSITMTVLLDAKYSLDDGKTWHILADGKGAGEQIG